VRLRGSKFFRGLRVIDFDPAFAPDVVQRLSAPIARSRPHRRAQPRSVSFCVQTGVWRRIGDHVRKNTRQKYTTVANLVRCVPLEGQTNSSPPDRSRSRVDSYCRLPTGKCLLDNQLDRRRENEREPSSSRAPNCGGNVRAVVGYVHVYSILGCSHKNRPDISKIDSLTIPAEPFAC